MNTLGERFRHFRESKSLSQEELASLVPGINQANITQWENNKATPNGKKLYAIKKTFPDLNTDWLFEGGEMIIQQPLPMALKKDEDGTILRMLDYLMKENTRLLGLLESAISNNPDFPEDSNAADSEIIYIWPAIQQKKLFA